MWGLVTVILVLGCAVHASQDDAEEQTGLEEKAAALLNEEERDEEDIHRETQRIHKNLAPQVEEIKDDDDDVPWKDEGKPQKTTQVKVSAVSEIHNDLGDSGVVSHKPTPVPTQKAEDRTKAAAAAVSQKTQVADATKTVVSDANALTSKAQATATAESVTLEKVADFAKAKQIAAKVRALVHEQQRLEAMAGKKVEGSVLGEAVIEHDKTAAKAEENVLSAHKAADDAALKKLRAEFNDEEQKQHKAFELEREQSHQMIEKLRNNLKMEEEAVVKHVEEATKASMLKVEDVLSQSSIAKHIEDVLKQKLSKRVAELQSMGEKVISSVSNDVSKLKSRVRRLRRDQEDLRVQGLKEVQKVESEAAKIESSLPENHRDLGESALSPLMSLQQQMMMQQQYTNPLNEQLHEMRASMEKMQEQNLQLKEEMRNQKSHTEYTHNDLKEFFDKKNTIKLSKMDSAIEEEQARLDHMKQLKQEEASLLQSQDFVQLAEGVEPTALPIFNQRVDQTRVEMEQLQHHALNSSKR